MCLFLLHILQNRGERFILHACLSWSRSKSLMTKNKRTRLRKYKHTSTCTFTLYNMTLFPYCAFQNPQYLDLRLLNWCACTCNKKLCFRWHGLLISHKYFFPLYQHARCFRERNISSSVHPYFTVSEHVFYYSQNKSLSAKMDLILIILTIAVNRNMPWMSRYFITESRYSAVMYQL